MAASILFCFAAALNTQFSRSFTVLELGSGPGHLVGHLLEHCPVTRYVAIDFSVAMHDLARRNLGPLAERCEFVVRDFRVPGWQADLGRFDAVVTLQAVHEVRHVQRVPALFQAVRQLTDGLFLYCDHYWEDGKNADLMLTRQAQPELLQAAGFAVEELLDAGGMALYAAR